MARGLMGAPFGLRCESCPRQHKCEEYPAVPWDERYKDLIGGGEKWGGRCPVAWLGHESVHAASHLLRAARVAPLADWPDGYPAHVTEAVIWMQEAREAT